MHACAPEQAQRVVQRCRGENAADVSTSKNTAVQYEHVTALRGRVEHRLQLVRRAHAQLPPCRFSPPLQLLFSLGQRELGLGDAYGELKVHGFGNDAFAVGALARFSAPTATRTRFSPRTRSSRTRSGSPA